MPAAERGARIEVRKAFQRSFARLGMVDLRCREIYDGRAAVVAAAGRWMQLPPPGGVAQMVRATDS